MGHRIKAGALPLAILTYAALALAIFPGTYANMLQSYFREAIVLPMFLGMVLPVASIVARPRAPFALLMEVLKNSAPRIILIMTLFCIGISAFTTFKLAIPQFMPFYADAFLADIDAFLHGGNPGEFAHAIVPAWAQYPLGYLYGPVWFALWFGLIGFVGLQDNARLRQRYFWSMAMTIFLLGTLAATAFSSVGPIYYAKFVEPERFSALLAAIRMSAVGDYMAQASAYLLASYQSDAAGFGTGISAMPSMHLAIVTLNACMLSSLNRLMGMLAWTYVALILLGSVYLGWHYAIDGYFSIAAVGVIWWAMGRALAASRAEAEPEFAAQPDALGELPVSAK